MKKILCLFILLGIIIGINFNSVTAEELSFDETVSEIYNAKYQVTSRLVDESLKYGLRHIKDLAQSQTTNLIVSGTSKGNVGEYDPQQVNILEVPSSSSARIVSWSYSSSSGWSTQTVTNLAKDFETENPGWIVLAAVNGDFFDINAKGALPKQTSGVCVSNGEIVRAISSGQQVGFTNNGTSTSLVGNQKWETTSYHVLTIYDENDQEVTSIKVDKFNAEPVDNEVSVYFSNYYLDSSSNRLTRYSTTPANNSYIVEIPIRGYANGETNLYANGYISSLNKEVQLEISQFAVVTTNPDITKYLNQGTRIRIQKEIVGAYASCDNVTGCGDTLLNNGEAPSNFATDQDYRHPRTIVGQKADGTVVLAVVDGRQTEKGMYGVAKDEMSALMSYYGCTEAYNLDGGGSTTMIIRNEQGGFDVQNSPSDGSERNDSNAILVVVPELNLTVEEATSDSVTVSYLAPSKEISVSNVTIHLTSDGLDKTYPMNDLQQTITGLNVSTDYKISITYDLEYNNKKASLESNRVEFTTGVSAPTVKTCYYKLVDDYYEFYFEIDDPNNTISLCSINYDRAAKIINKNNTSCSIAASKVKNPVFTLELNFNVNASPNKSDKSLITISEYQEPEPDPDLYPEPDVENRKGCKKGINLVMGLIGLTTTVAIALRKKH